MLDPRPFQVGELRVDPTLHRVFRAGEEPVTLEPKVMQVLACLAERPGEVVSREELLAAVWVEAHVSEDPLNRAVSELRKLFGDNPRKPRYIETIHKRGYRLIAPVVVDPDPLRVEATTEEALLERGLRERLQGFLVLAALAVVVAAVIILMALWRSDRAAELPETGRMAALRTIPITTFPGRENNPALSPDGRRVAFDWVGPEGTSRDIYVKQRNSEQPLRLTDDPASDVGPGWSPDGTSLAFTRLGSGGSSSPCSVRVVPAIGGPERTVYHCTGGALLGLDWSPDGEWLAVADQASVGETYRIFLVSLATGERYPVTAPSRRESDALPRFSPDGRRLAFRRGYRDNVHEILWIPLDPAQVATDATPEFVGQEPHRLTDDGADLGGYDWTPQGDGIVYSSNRGGGFGLWRRSMDGGEPRWLGFDNAFVPSVTPAGMVFEQRRSNISLWRVSLDPDPAAAVAQRWIASTRADLDPVYSVDGEHIAFVSQRSGSDELWVAPSSGEAPRQLTSFGRPAPAWQPAVEHPTWSPDGRWIVFAAQEEAGFRLWRVAAEGGVPQRLSIDPRGEPRAPCWSSDGFLYFVAGSRGGRSEGAEVWRMEPDPSEPASVATVTEGVGEGVGGVFPRLVCGADSEGEGWLYYTRGAGRRPPRLLRLQLRDGRPVRERELGGVPTTDWAATSAGFYTFGVRKGEPILMFLPGFSATRRLVPATLGLPAGGRAVRRGGLALSPDGRWALYARLEGDESDLVLVETPEEGQ